MSTAVSLPYSLAKHPINRAGMHIYCQRKVNRPDALTAPLSWNPRAIVIDIPATILYPISVCTGNSACTSSPI